MTTLKMNSTFNPLFVIAILFAFVFTACEQENLNELVTSNESPALVHSMNSADLADAETVAMDMNAINKKMNSELQNRSLRIPIFSGEYAVNQGEWLGFYLDYQALSAAHKYIAVITPLEGTPELHVYGYNLESNEYRHIRNAIQLDEQIKEVHFTKADFEATATHTSFYAYGTTATVFQIDIYTEETYNGSLNETEVNGRNVNFIKFTDDSGELLGTFIQRGAEGQWDEEGMSQGEVRYDFQEVTRDDWSVYLRDDSRGVNVQLDLHTKKVMYSDDENTEKRELYTIVEEYAKTNGWVVSQVRFGDSEGNFLGSYVKYDNDTWIEEGTTTGSETFRFKEVGRNEWTVYLQDESRGVNIELGMHSKVVNYTDATYTTPVTIYLIQDAI